MPENSLLVFRKKKFPTRNSLYLFGHRFSNRTKSDQNIVAHYAHEGLAWLFLLKVLDNGVSSADTIRSVIAFAIR